MLASLAALPYTGPHPFFFAPFLILIPLFWVAVIALVLVLVGRRRRSFMRTYGVGHGGVRGAESTLAERFAQGDIEEVEYRARLEVLRANRLGPDGR